MKIRSLKNVFYAATIFGITSQAFAVDLSTYPTDYLGPIVNAKASVNKGTAVCSLTGTTFQGGAPIFYSGHSRLTADGIRDSAGFGHFTSPVGRESYVLYSFALPLPDGSVGAGTCVNSLDLTASKYAVNKFGRGISELHWLADPNNPSGCQPFIDQLEWVMDINKHAIVTRINDSPTTNRAAQTSDCYPSY